jgi:hypothetical protein
VPLITEMYARPVKIQMFSLILRVNALLILLFNIVVKEFLKASCALRCINLYVHIMIKTKFNAKNSLAQKQSQTVASHAKIAPFPIISMGPVLKRHLKRTIALLVSYLARLITICYAQMFISQCVGGSIKIFSVWYILAHRPFRILAVFAITAMLNIGQTVNALGQEGQ